MRWHLGRYAVLRALPVLLLLATMSAWAQTTDTNLYIHCSFYPQGDGCERVYQQALRDQGPLAASVRDAFKYYARYLRPASAGLTDDDRRYLGRNQIRMPFEL
ncbi:MAG: hypothetical protein JWO50_873, partial [Candidatus Kaiserbacteria bacterium]|nr:hypothetical protein [Candidatus Kaiserbacteria bacterium]